MKIMQPFSFDHLDETQFEEFCYDLLGEIGFINRSWRKGTGLTSSPSDRGRDIECDREVPDPAGNKYLEKWFVECKHHKKGVSPDKLQGVLTWATAERPDHVLIIVSNFLSNAAKDYLEDYKNKNTPPFRIHGPWERPDLERLTVGKSRLLRKYGIGGSFPFLSILHPAHLLYLRSGPFNTLDYLLTVLENLDSVKRDDLLAMLYRAIINPRSRPSVTGKETISELWIDEVTYEVFKAKCRQTATVFDQRLLVFCLVHFVLKFQFSISDFTRIDVSRERHEADIEHFNSLLRGLDADSGEDREDLDFYLGTLRARKLPLTEEDFREENLRDNFKAIINTLSASLIELESRTRKNYSLYEYFCENVITELLKEEEGFL
jgi:hypothetical protein